MFGAAPQIAEPTTNNPVPASIIVRRPWISAILP